MGSAAQCSSVGAACKWKLTLLAAGMAAYFQPYEWRSPLITLLHSLSTSIRGWPANHDLQLEPLTNCHRAVGTQGFSLLQSGMSQERDFHFLVGYTRCHGTE